MKNLVRGVFVTGLIAVLMSTGCAEKTIPVIVDTIYFNGYVITLDSGELVAEAIAVKDGKIIAVGDSKTIFSMSGENTLKVNLEGKIMLPGFIDTHSHPSAGAVQVETANSLPPPDGPGQNIAALQQTLRGFIATSAMAKEHRVYRPRDGYLIKR